MTRTQKTNGNVYFSIAQNNETLNRITDGKDFNMGPPKNKNK